LDTESLQTAVTGTAIHDYLPTFNDQPDRYSTMPVDARGERPF